MTVDSNWGGGGSWIASLVCGVTSITEGYCKIQAIKKSSSRAFSLFASSKPSFKLQVHKKCPVCQRESTEAELFPTVLLPEPGSAERLEESAEYRAYLKSLVLTCFCIL